MREPGRILYGPRAENKAAVSLGVHYVECLTRYGDNVAQIQEIDGRAESRTFSELMLQGKRVACFLRERGLGSGDTVWISCGNTLAFTPIMLGTLFIGAAIAPVLPLLDASEVLHLLGVIEPQLVICNKDAEAALTSAIAQCGVAVNMVALETVEKAMEADTEVSDFKMAPVEDPASHVALVMCSSGTSGKPKGVEITHKGFLTQVDYLFYSSKDEPSLERKVVMNLSNPNWATAQISYIISLSKGMLLILLENFTEKDFLNLVQKYKVNHALLKPYDVVALAKWPDIELYDVSSLKNITYGGSSIKQGMADVFRKRLQTQLVTIYGMTETMGITIPPYANPDKRDTLGTLFANAAAKVVDTETEELLGPNCMGELCLQTPSMMKRYRNNPAATLSVFDKDGFYHTGDVVHYDDDGFIHFHDRMKELIKYKQHGQDARNISAGDIEEVLLTHACVLQASVVGIPHDTDYEHATAFVVRQPGSDVTELELLTLVEGTLPSYKWLHGGLYFLDSLPKTASGKILKRELRARLTR